MHPIVLPGIVPAGQVVPDTLPPPPLPGGVAAVVRWFFNRPQWLEIGGAVLGLLAGILLLVYLWKQRRAMWSWILSRQRAIQVALGAAAVLLVTLAAWVGRVSWNYTQHSNDFCVACHVMTSPFQRFQHSKHADLECHDCHQQPLAASIRQVYLWVKDRPEQIGPHAPVPNRVCVRCHVQQQPDSVWEQIAQTVGHRVHFAFVAGGLGGVSCVTCHGQEVHQFVPADQTCGQAGCHDTEQTSIRLGKMASSQTSLHCLACHDFTTAVPDTTSAATARARLVPTEKECLSCHEMRNIDAVLAPAEDPHEGRCGTCHDPHTQTRPLDAFGTCTNAGCHSRPDTLTAFHRGLGAEVLLDCGRCHKPHTWVVKGSDCALCHSNPPRKLRPEVTHPIHGETALRPRGPDRPSAGAAAGDGGGSTSGAPSPGRGGPRDVLSSFLLQPPAERRVDHPPIESAEPAAPAPPQDLPRVSQARQPWPDFDHKTHRTVTCTACHGDGKTHGALKIHSEADCSACHHSTRPIAGRPAGTECRSCHSAPTLTGVRQVTRTMQLSVWDSPRVTELPFDHARHADLACSECHTPPGVGNAAPCADCHREHHVQTAECAVCHRPPPVQAHPLLVHNGTCTGSGCHTSPDAYTAWVPTRDFCLLCHAQQRDHIPGRVCVACHKVPERPV